MEIYHLGSKVIDLDCFHSFDVVVKVLDSDTTKHCFSLNFVSLAGLLLVVATLHPFLQCFVNSSRDSILRHSLATTVARSMLIVPFISPIF